MIISYDCKLLTILLGIVSRGILDEIEQETMSCNLGSLVERKLLSNIKCQYKIIYKFVRYLL